jgi:hypothetical protein
MMLGPLHVFLLISTSKCTLLELDEIVTVGKNSTFKSLKLEFFPVHFLNCAKIDQMS